MDLVEYVKSLSDQELKETLKNIENELSNRNKSKQVIIEEKLQKKTFILDELVFAAQARCRGCSLGLAYPKNTQNPFDSWRCSGLMLGNPILTPKCTEEFPFAFWKILSEIQPSANGETTKPRL